MIHLIVDYKKNGVWTNQAFQLFGTCDEQAAALAAAAQVCAFGGVPLAVHRIYGRYTLDELANLEDGPRRLVWCDAERLTEVLEKERAQA